MVRSRSNCQEDWQLTKCSVKERFAELLKLSQWTDCAFIVGPPDCSEVVRCHKLILAASSPVFEAMFYGGFSNSSDCNSTTSTSSHIKITDIDPTTFKLFLRYVYCDSQELHSIEEAGSMLYLSKKYILPHLSKICLNYLYDHTYLQTLWDILPLAESLDESHLVDLCVKVMCRYKAEVWMKDGERLSNMVMSRLLEEKAMAMTEYELWQFFCKWVKVETMYRGPGYNPISECGIIARIRFSALSEKEWSEVLESGLLKGGDVIEASNIRSVAPCLPRSRPLSLRLRSTRDVLKRGRYMAIIDSSLTTRITATDRILVTGFEVFSRSGDFHSSLTPSQLHNLHQNNPPLSILYPLINGNSNNHFNQNDSSNGVSSDLWRVEVRNRDGLTLNLSSVKLPSHLELPYKSEYDVLLSEPIWFEPNTEYSVIFYVKGVYEVHECPNYSVTRASLGTCFHYTDSELTSDNNSLHQFAYVSGVLYSL